MFLFRKDSVVRHLLYEVGIVSPQNQARNAVSLLWGKHTLKTKTGHPSHDGCWTQERVCPEKNRKFMALQNLVLCEFFCLTRALFSKKSSGNAWKKTPQPSLICEKIWNVSSRNKSNFLAWQVKLYQKVYADSCRITKDFLTHSHFHSVPASSKEKFLACLFPGLQFHFVRQGRKVFAKCCLLTVCCLLFSGFTFLHYPLFLSRFSITRSLVAEILPENEINIHQVNFKFI